MKVQNINGTSEKACKCGSWLNHWIKYARGGKADAQCVASGCPNIAEVGAHIQMDSKTDRAWYIVPFCREHNSKIGETIEITVFTSFASANVAETCR